MGTKCAGRFSLSSDLIVGSKSADCGLVGVRGMSSERSETVVLVLMGEFVNDENDERRGVTGGDEG